MDITRAAPGIRLDIRYATPDNFTGVAVYPAPRCFLRADVAARLARVQAELEKQGLGLKVYDCYRPLFHPEALLGPGPQRGLGGQARGKGTAGPSPGPSTTGGRPWT